LNQGFHWGIRSLSALKFDFRNQFASALHCHRTTKRAVILGFPLLIGGVGTPDLVYPHLYMEIKYMVKSSLIYGL